MFPQPDRMGNMLSIFPWTSKKQSREGRGKCNQLVSREVKQGLGQFQVLEDGDKM